MRCDVPIAFTMKSKKYVSILPIWNKSVKKKIKEYKTIYNLKKKRILFLEQHMALPLSAKQF